MNITVRKIKGVGPDARFEAEATLPDFLKDVADCSVCQFEIAVRGSTVSVARDRLLAALDAIRLEIEEVLG